MRFMMFMIPAVYQGKRGRTLGSDFAPDADAVEKMMRYNEELARSGALISLDGFHPLSMGARVSFSSDKPRVTDGKLVNAKDVVGGYWMIRVKSREEAVEWAKRVPAGDGDIIEIRQVFEESEFPEDVRKAAESPEVRKAIDTHKRSA